MKKVYGDIRSILIFGPVFFLFLYSYFFDKNATLLGVIGSGLFFFMALFFYVFPVWSYDDKGFKYGIFKPITYSWKDIDCMVSLKYSNFVIAVTKNNFPLILSAIGTRNYFKVLAYVVRNVQKNNPKAIINPRILKKLKNVPKFYIL